MSDNKPISYVDFTTSFNTEEKCREHMFNIRWPNGFECPKCKNQKYYPIKRGNLYQCAACNYQASVTAGTVMDRSRIPLVKWFWAIYMVSTDKRGCSATVLTNKLNISYKTAWYLLKRIQTAMMEHDWDYILSGTVEVDDVFFGAADDGGKRGRGTDKAQVIVGLSLNEKGRPKYIKMETIANLTANTVGYFAASNIKTGSIISTDAYSSFNKLTDDGYEHLPKVYRPKEDKEHLKWLHTIVSNAKAFINGTYHGLDKKHLDFYLAEFCYRFNRRFEPGQLFVKLLHSCVVGVKFSYAELTV